MLRYSGKVLNAKAHADKQLMSNHIQPMSNRFWQQGWIFYALTNTLCSISPTIQPYFFIDRYIEIKK